MSQEGLTVFFPAYNDAPSLPELVGKTFRVLEELSRDFEVIVVNDGSTDETGQVLGGLQRQYGSRLRIVTHPRNLGYGAALRSGFREARKELVFYTDGDGQYDVGELPLLLDELKPDVGLVNGYKMSRNDAWYRAVAGAAYKALVRRLFRIQLADVDCDFRLIRRCLLENIDLRSTSGTICVELVHKLERSGTRIVQVPVHHYPRLHGRSQFFRPRPLLNTLSQLTLLFFQLMVSQ